MARFCDKCGNELKNDNARFCDKCGAEVKVTIQTNAGTGNMGGMVICPRCGQTTPMGLTHCDKCGSALEDNTTAVIVGYIVTFLLGILGIIPAIYLLTRDNGKAKTQGVFLIGLIIISAILNFTFNNWILAHLLIIVLMALGIYLWYNEYTIF